MLLVDVFDEVVCLRCRPWRIDGDVDDKISLHIKRRVVGCVLPPFRADNNFDATMNKRGDDLGEREKKAKNQVSEPKRLSSLLFSETSSVFPSLSPSPRRRLFLLFLGERESGRCAERERDAGTTENASVADDPEQSSDDE